MKKNFFIFAFMILCGLSLWAMGPKGNMPREKQAPAVIEKRFPVLIRELEQPMIKTDRKDHFDQEVMVDCASCHATKPPNDDLKDATALREFHRGLKFNHGNLSCLSCHNSNDYNTLKKADGHAVKYSEVMQLCAQCHGPQYRDYKNGSHGGMTGYWDLTKGPRQRNNCVDCHNAHAPAFPKFHPVFPPKDRFLKKRDKTHD